jgi:ribosomal protein L21
VSLFLLVFVSFLAFRGMWVAKNNRFCIMGAHMATAKKTTNTEQFAVIATGGATTNIGTPLLAGATVTGEVASVGRAQKEIVIKYKQKSRYFKKNGHRQPYVKVTITAIA